MFEDQVLSLYHKWFYRCFNIETISMKEITDQQVNFRFPLEYSHAPKCLV